MMTTTTTFFAPTRPYSIVDAVNRAALATGSATRAQQGAHADYNGHLVIVERGDYSYGSPLHDEADKEARGWRAYYTWSGPNYLARSTNFAAALGAAMREYHRGALGASVRVRAHTAEQAAACEAAGLLAWSKEAEEAADAAWRTDVHNEVGTALWYESKMGVPAISLLIASTSAAEFRAKIDDFLAERRASYASPRER
jgi:hypothetical protein